jgi:peptide/nickel transport system substrate-binding protein
VKFHDGTDFDADDVKFSLDRARAENSTNAQKGLFAGIESVEVVDPATVKSRSRHQRAFFLWNMGLGDAVIVAPESAETNKEKPVGTGPFKFDSWAKGSSVKLVKSDATGAIRSRLTKVEFRVIPDAAAAVPALLSGDVQAFPNAPLGDARPQLEADARLKVVIGVTEGETILAMNNKKPPFRQAGSATGDCVSYRPRVHSIAGNGSGLGTPIGSHMSPANPAYVDLVNTYPLRRRQGQRIPQGRRAGERLQGDAEAAACALCARWRPGHRNPSCARSA